MSQQEFADELRVNRSYLSEIENGRVTASDKIVERLEILERQSVEKPTAAEQPSTYGKPPAQHLGQVPLVGWAQAMDAENFTDFTDLVEWEEFIPSDIRDPKAIAVRIRGDSMEPNYKEGDIAILACSSPPRSGNLIVGRLKQEGAVFKMFQVLSVDPPRYRLESFSPHYAPIERTAADFIWIYPVHSVIKKLM